MASGFGSWGKTKSGAKIFVTASAMSAGGISKVDLKAGNVASEDIAAANKKIKDRNLSQNSRNIQKKIEERTKELEKSFGFNVYKSREFQAIFEAYDNPSQSPELPLKRPEMKEVKKRLNLIPDTPKKGGEKESFFQGDQRLEYTKYAKGWGTWKDENNKYHLSFDSPVALPERSSQLASIETFKTRKQALKTISLLEHLDITSHIFTSNASLEEKQKHLRFIQAISKRVRSF